METRDIATNFFAKLTKDFTLTKDDKENKMKESVKQELTKQVKPSTKAESHQKISGNQNRRESDSLTVQKIKSDTLLFMADSLDNDSSEVTEMQKYGDTLKALDGAAESIIVKKDKLVYSTLVKAKPEIPVNGVKDSLITEISGTQRDEERNEYTVEFWESPINYKGYKMANRKLILFGLPEPYDNIAVLYSDKKVYFLHNNIRYLIENSYNFKPLEKASESKVLGTNLMNK